MSQRKVLRDMHEQSQRLATQLREPNNGAEGHELIM